MQVLVSYELTTEHTAYVDYEELAEAWAKDAKSFGKAARPPLPSKETLRNSTGVDIDQYADAAVDSLLTAHGSLADSRLAKIIDIAEVP